MTTVLVVDDEPIVRDVVVRYLRRDGFDTLEAADGETAQKLIEGASPELVVLDVMLPGTVGLELGADDYVTKPFSPRELAARVRTVLRRSSQAPPSAERLVFDGLVLDARSRDVELDGRSLRLTAKEFDLLFFLASNPRQVFSRDQLMERVWGYAAALDTGTVTVHIQRLRSKIEHDPRRPQHLETVWGVGYRFVP